MKELKVRYGRRRWLGWLLGRRREDKESWSPIISLKINNPKVQVTDIQVFKKGDVYMIKWVELPIGEEFYTERLE